MSSCHLQDGHAGTVIVRLFAALLGATCIHTGKMALVPHVVLHVPLLAIVRLQRPEARKMCVFQLEVFAVEKLRNLIAWHSNFLDQIWDGLILRVWSDMQRKRDKIDAVQI